jgi:hypothetical protein
VSVFDVYKPHSSKSKPKDFNLMHEEKDLTVGDVTLANSILPVLIVSHDA